MDHVSFNVVVEQIQALGYDLASWMSRTIHQDTVMVGSTVMVFVVMFKLLRAR